MFRLTASALSHVGIVRQVNEDSVLADPERALWAVADGMGGHQRGDWASAQVVAALDAARLAGDLDRNCELLVDAIEDANRTIHDAGERDGSVYGSTLVLLHVVGRRYLCLWAGDSRLYVAGADGLRRISRDHSQVEELVAAGVISRDQARDHPLGNVITRAIGVSADLSLDLVTGELRDNDRLLLCSDGLTRCVDDPELDEAVRGGSVADACAILLQRCLDRGAPDNVSLVLVGCEVATPAPVAARAGD